MRSFPEKSYGKPYGAAARKNSAEMTGIALTQWIFESSLSISFISSFEWEIYIDDDDEKNLNLHAESINNNDMTRILT